MATRNGGTTYYCDYCVTDDPAAFVIEPDAEWGPNIDAVMDHLVCDHGMDPDVAQDDALGMIADANAAAGRVSRRRPLYA